MAQPSPDAAAATPSRRRRRPRRFPAAVAAIHLLLLLAALPAVIRPRIANTPPFALAAGPSSQASKTGTRENVGGVSVEIGEKVSNQGVDAIVYHAKHGSKDVIYKEPLPHKKLWPNEVDATRAAGQLVAAEGNKMVQNKVGTTGLKDWLQTQKNSPEAKSKYLLTDEKPEDHRGKIKLSDAIYGQVAQHQKDVGFVHHDTNSGNIRVHASPSDKPVKFAGVRGESRQGTVPKMELIDWGHAKKVSPQHTVEGRKVRDQASIKMACFIQGFQFRADRGALLRRAPGKGRCGGAGGGTAGAKTAVGRRATASAKDGAATGGGGGARGGAGGSKTVTRNGVGAATSKAAASERGGDGRANAASSRMAVKTQGGNVGGGAKDGGKAAPPTSRRSAKQQQPAAKPAGEAVRGIIAQINLVRLLSSGFDSLLPARGPSDPTTTKGLAAAEALRAAAINSHLNVVRLLADRIHGGDLSALDTAHVFEEACAGGHVETVQFLLDHTDADPAHGGNQGLVRAASGGHADVVRVLLVDERVRGGDVTVALMSAVRCGHEGVMRPFVRFGLIEDCELEAASVDAFFDW
ncbi:hypothetical protein DFJ73DRAFT_963443 [Zopfochytrium polystomum]|nr:hypothetical protein DFJ73DRAFT_963443 [Zopfochytrium polystomum]